MVDPRCAGKPTHGQRESFVARSIPACAEKSCWPSRSWSNCRVNPRMCGEADAFLNAELRQLGRSPHVRGSHAESQGRGESLRSIPACAGKPRRSTTGATACQVDPRMCGEAILAARWRWQWMGRFPHKRGSRDPLSGALVPAGSISAYAGKLVTWRTFGRSSMVDPRMRDQTSSDKNYSFTQPRLIP